MRTRVLPLLGIVWLIAVQAPAQETKPAVAAPKAENVILVLIDGLRCQEVFSGADEQLLDKPHGGIEDVDAVRKTYWRDSPSQRRATLLPFLWTTIAAQGQIYGNQASDCSLRVANGLNFSYPGYSEMLVGFGDARVDSNDKRPNPNVTVLEWLAHKPRWADRVAAFAAWDTVPYILNRERCGFFINAGFEPLPNENKAPELDLLNRLKAEIPAPWDGEAHDALTFHSALVYLQRHQPRVFYLALGETDEWAHEGRYARYLEAARRSDDYVRVLWETVQAMPQYRARTTLLVVADHGRGNTPDDWRKHGKDIPGSENVWLAVLGPDTPSLGERSNLPPLTLSQVAATLAAALGEDFCAAVPAAAPPVVDAVRVAPR